MRLDKFIAQQLGVSRAIAGREIRGNRVTVDGRDVLKMTTVIANNVTSFSVLKIARNVTRKTILPPAAAANVTPYWLIRTIC
ncbi:MAG: hypothetical protein I4N50_22250, partial [Rhizobium sp.]|nr:hypothetical protein [Rhizobium sp.]